MLRMLQAMLLGLFCAAALSAQAASERPKIALVVGNGAYEKAPALPNPSRDAGAVADTLTAIGFTVTRASDADQKKLRATIADFAGAVADAGPDAVAFVYYAGHGVQLGGVNYLIPVDADIRRSSDVALVSVSIDEILAALDRTPAKTRVVVLDACRDNPFAALDAAIQTSVPEIAATTEGGRPDAIPVAAGASAATRGLALASGLARAESPTGTLIAFATSPGAAALDGDGSNSPYAGAFVELAREPGQSLETLFRRVRLRVHTVTGGKQTPWESSSLTEEIALVPGAATGEAAASDLFAARGPRLVAPSKTAWNSALAGEFAGGVVLQDEAVFAMPPSQAKLQRLLVRLPADARNVPELLELSAAAEGAAVPFKPFVRLRLRPGGEEQSFSLPPTEAPFLKVRIVGAPEGDLIVPKLAFAGVEEAGDDSAALVRLGADKAFERVLLDGSAAAWRLWLAAFPDDRRAARIRSLVSLDDESAAWMIAVGIDTPEAYRDFQTRFPGGVHAGEAAMRLDELLAGARPLARLASLAAGNVCPALPGLNPPTRLVPPRQRDVSVPPNSPPPSNNPPPQRDTRATPPFVPPPGLPPGTGVIPPPVDLGTPVSIPLPPIDVGRPGRDRTPDNDKTPKHDPYPPHDTGKTGNPKDDSTHCETCDPSDSASKPEKEKGSRGKTDTSDAGTSSPETGKAGRGGKGSRDIDTDTTAKEDGKGRGKERTTAKESGRDRDKAERTPVEREAKQRRGSRGKSDGARSGRPERDAVAKRGDGGGGGRAIRGSRGGGERAARGGRGGGEFADGGGGRRRGGFEGGGRRRFQGGGGRRGGGGFGGGGIDIGGGGIGIGGIGIGF